MERINGVNLGNWLVLEHWMSPRIFDGVEAVDEIWLSRDLDADELQRRLHLHRDTYVTEEDFAEIARHGLNLVRIPVPYFLFGDCPPHPGCVEYLDRAFEWAEKHSLKILIDLHTVPGSQNGYDNGGITGVCKWRRNPEDVEFALTVLERLARRYGKRESLYGIEVLNEPISWIVYRTAPSTGKARDRAEARGSGYVPLFFLRDFYTRAYHRIRTYLPEDKAVVFHDGFRCTAWNRFFRKAGFRNTVLDTHIYIFAMELFVPIAKPWVYRLFLRACMAQVRKAQRDIPVIVGEWCISTKYAENALKQEHDPEKASVLRRARYREIYELQTNFWQETAGQIYWSYQLRRDRNEKPDQSWKESWDLRHCWQKGWIG